MQLLTLFSSQTYIFEAPVEDLQLLLGELRLFLQLVHAFRAVTHGGELKVIFHAVCDREGAGLTCCEELNWSY